MSRYRRMPLSKLIIDKAYQRELDQRRVNAIAENFNPALLGALEISVRNGKAAVFDGQHRLAALKKLKADDAPCLVHEGLSIPEEAALFVSLQAQRKNLRPIDKFKARLVAGDVTAMAVNQIVSDVDLTVGDSGIRAVTALERIYKREGEEILRSTLSTVRILWDGDDRYVDGYLLEGMAQFLRGYGNRIDKPEIKRLRAVAPTAILRRALGTMQGGGSHARHAVEAELRKVAGVRGRPMLRKPAEEAIAA